MFVGAEVVNPALPAPGRLALHGLPSPRLCKFVALLCMRWRAGVLGGGFAVEEPSRWEATETDLRCVVREVLAETRRNDRPSRITEGDISGKLAQRFHHS